LGVITVIIPVWHQSGLKTFEMVNAPECTAVSNMNSALSCTYEPLSHTLKVINAVSVETTTTLEFRVSNFNNPKSTTAQGGFQV
jgi:hypothetical protein